MTPKQKLRSLEKKMERMKGLGFDIEEAARHFLSVKKYHELQMEHLHLKFEIEHCPTCFREL